jgi:phytoene synthase
LIDFGFMDLPTPTVEESFRHCERIAKEHYENFPVASLAVPRRLRPDVWAVYSFARAADDFADEGSRPAAERLEALDAWERKLDETVAGRPPADPVFVALGDTIARTSLPVEPLRDLLTAFRMDVTTPRHRTFDDLLAYCRCSANPVGRLVLHLFSAATPDTVQRSDDVCTALQLANFWQDIAVDLRQERIYLPLDDLARFGYTEQDLGAGVVDDRFRGLLAFQVDRTRALFLRGRPLLAMVDGRLRFELDLTWRGGMAVLEAIERCGFDVFRSRPVVGRADRLRILAAAIFGRQA